MNDHWQRRNETDKAAASGHNDCLRKLGSGQVCAAKVEVAMAVATHRYQVVFRVRAHLAAPHPVMDL